jgi:cysteine synthase B
MTEETNGNGETDLRSQRNIISRIGNTPLLELKNLSKEVAPVRIFAKAEWFNPAGSVKDRPALNMVLEAKKSGELSNGKILLDATSGNTGIAYAMIGAALGIKIKLAIPGNAGRLFKQILTAYGADLHFSDPQQGSDGAIRAARRLMEEEPDKYYYPDQYNNPANWMAHYNGTGVEILEQTQGEVTHFVAGLGTSGTFTGTSRRLKEFDGDIKVISFEPDSPFHGLEGLKHMETAIVPGIYDPSIADENLEIATEEAQLMVQRLAREGGLLVGISSGAAAAAAMKIARDLDSGTIVAIFPDSAHKYFDQRFWNGAF